MQAGGRAVAEPGIVGEVRKHFGAGEGKLTHQLRVHRLPADEGADSQVPGLEQRHVGPRREARLARQETGREVLLGERQETDLVVAAGHPPHMHGEDGVVIQRTPIAELVVRASE